jgi:hypothetical protein
VVDDPLELGGGRTGLVRGEIRLPARTRWDTATFPVDNCRPGV